MESIIIPIEKKSGAQECVDFRTISLVTHASKYCVKDINSKTGKQSQALSRNNDNIYLPVRAGCQKSTKGSVWFQERLWTRDAIAAMRVLCDRSLEHNNTVYVCYVDYEKAFDRVNWDKLMTVLKSIGRGVYRGGWGRKLRPVWLKGGKEFHPKGGRTHPDN